MNKRHQFGNFLKTIAIVKREFRIKFFLICDKQLTNVDSQRRAKYNKRKPNPS